MNNIWIWSISIIIILVIVIVLKMSMQTSNNLESGTIEEALYCMDCYIDSIKNLPDYPLVMESLKKYLDDESVILSEFGTNKLTPVIDSAVLFNKRMDFSCLILIIQTLEGPRNDYATVYHGTKIENKWIISEGMGILYRREKDSVGNYIPYSLNYLSSDTRLDFIADGFFKNRHCEIDWSYVEKYRE